jgi:hypothetical protein
MRGDEKGDALRQVIERHLLSKTGADRAHQRTFDGCLAWVCGPGSDALGVALQRWAGRSER